LDEAGQLVGVVSKHINENGQGLHASFGPTAVSWFPKAFAKLDELLAAEKEAD
jgi:hypothetical protein